MFLPSIFRTLGHITLIGVTNEGKGENPALFPFTNCYYVVALTPGLATPDRPIFDAKYADGMLFDDCREFSVT